MEENVLGIKNMALFEKAITNIIPKKITLPDDKVVQLVQLLPRVVELGVNLGHKIRLHLQLTGKEGFLLYLVDFTKEDEEDGGDTKKNFLSRIKTSKLHHKKLPSVFAENILMSEIFNDWGWYISFIPTGVKTIQLEMNPQNLDNLKKQIMHLIMRHH